MPLSIFFFFFWTANLIYNRHRSWERPTATNHYHHRWNAAADHHRIPLDLHNHTPCIPTTTHRSWERPTGETFQCIWVSFKVLGFDLSSGIGISLNLLISLTSLQAGVVMLLCHTLDFTNANGVSSTIKYEEHERSRLEEFEKFRK